MASHLNWGILATGRIAHQFAGGLRVSQTGELVAVGSRSMEAAKAFCGRHGGRPYATYEEVLADPRVDAVYIAMPHHLHAEWTIRTAEAGKGILCEKPFTLTAPEAQSALEAVRKAGVFFMEAFMYRCHPQTLRVKELVEAGAIGQVTMVASEFGYGAARDSQNFRFEGIYGGGALMDVGTYCVSFSRLIAGSDPVRAAYMAEITDRGYDGTGSGALMFANGMSAHFGAALHQQLENRARVFGSTGVIEIDAPWKCYKGSKTRILRDGKVDAEWDLSSDNDHLYAYEADAVARNFEAGECPHVTIADTLGQMRTLDMLRESAGIRF